MPIPDDRDDDERLLTYLMQIEQALRRIASALERISNRIH